MDSLPTMDCSTAFVLAVKQTFPDQTDNYREFLKLLFDFRDQKINKETFLLRLKQLLVNHRNLRQIFVRDFLPKECDVAHLLYDDKEEEPPPPPPPRGEVRNFVSKAERRLRHHEYKSFCDSLSMYYRGYKPLKTAYQEAVRSLDPDLLEELKTVFPEGSIGNALCQVGENASSDEPMIQKMDVDEHQKEKFITDVYCGNSVSQNNESSALDLPEVEARGIDKHEREKPTPTYILLPRNPSIRESGCAENDLSVLNNECVIDKDQVLKVCDDWVGSSKRKHQSPYERNKFDLLEDEMFTGDMLVQSFKAEIERLEALIGKVKEDKSICIEDHLTPQNLRCVEHLYGDHALDMIEAIRKRPRRGLPVVLNRLHQKKMDLLEARKELIYHLQNN